MSFIPLSAFDPALLHCELAYSKPQNPTDKPKPRIKMTYGPTRRALSFITAAIVVDWPYLHGDGNYGTKFGPPDVDKAQFIVGLTDKPLPATGNTEAGPLFTALEQIDTALVAFAHKHQKEFLNSRDLSLAEIKGKMCHTVKSKFDENDVPSYRRVNLATRKFDWKGEEHPIRVVDCKRQVLEAPIRHQDICMVALQLDCVYTISSMFGCKWNVCEAMLVARASSGDAAPKAPVDEVWGAIDVPTWADAGAGFY